ncbi:MAG: hypothetical protein M3Y65_21770 [Pseudomonadota bacterium]|nr:hypothetical protein [Pseudomonadota bacterium]
MSEFVNDRDIFLEAQGNLNLDPRGGKVLLLTVDPVMFRVAAGGVGSPAVATFKATAVNIGGSITWIPPAGVSLRGNEPDERTVSFAEMDVETATVRITMEYQGELYEAEATVSKLYDGSAVTTYTWIRYGTSAAGANFNDSPAGATYIGLAYNKLTALESESPADYQWVLIKGQDGIGVPGEPGADGQTLWTWIKYSDNADGTGLYDLPTENTLYIGLAANKFSPIESMVKADYVWSKFKGGQGVPGAPGATTYTWIKYASSVAGAALSDSPDGKAYIGFAYNKSTAVESTIPADYSWSLLRGEDGVGVPGAPGADGVTLYTWIKYSDNADGTGLYDFPTDNTVYIGISVNRTTPAESTQKTDYVWSRFKGAPGVPGEAGAPGAPGTATFTWIKYASSVNGAAISDSPDGKGYIGFAYNKPTPTESMNAADYKWSLLRGEDGVGVPGAPGNDGVTLYTWIKYADAADGTGLYDTPNDNTIYIGISVNRTTPAESSVKTDYVWSRFKGAVGIPGEPGAPGGTGVRGNVNLSGETTGNAWSDSQAAVVIAANGFGAPRTKDVVTLYNPTSSFVATRIFNGAGWEVHAKSFDGSILVSGTVFTEALCADAVTTDKLAASAITAGKIAADAITAIKIAAEAITSRHIGAEVITARMLKIGTSDNIVPDPAFRDLAWWGRPSGITNNYSATSSVWSTGYSLVISPATGSYQSTDTQFFPMTPGATYLVSFQVYISNDFAGNVSAYWYIPNVAFDLMGAPNLGYNWNDGLPVSFDTNSPKGPRPFTKTVIVPNNGFTSRTVIRIRSQCTAGTLEIGDFSITRVVDQTLIGPGSVLTKHLDIATGGDIHSGQQGFDAGDGFWLEGEGRGHGARMSIGRQFGRKIIMDPANDRLELVNPQLSSSMTASVSPSDFGLVRNANQQFTDVYAGNYTASAGNASGNLTYQWAVSSESSAVTANMDSPTSRQCVISVTGKLAVGQEVTVFVYCTVTDVDNRVARGGIATITLQTTSF